jgi:hypothetical protein
LNQSESRDQDELDQGENGGDPGESVPPGLVQLVPPESLERALVLVLWELVRALVLVL